jgi:hypothetical protein
MNRLAAALCGAALMALLSGCPGVPQEPQKPAVKAKPASFEDRLPKRADLPCFPCHSIVKFEKGPFPHKKAPHKGAGHCHFCHMGSGHEGRSIDRSACLTCHEADSEEIQILSKSDTPSK